MTSTICCGSTALYLWEGMVVVPSGLCRDPCGHGWDVHRAAGVDAKDWPGKAKRLPRLGCLVLVGGQVIQMPGVAVAGASHVAAVRLGCGAVAWPGWSCRCRVRR